MADTTTAIQRVPQQAIQTVRLIKEGGLTHLGGDTGQGSVFRPFGKGRMGERLSTLETLWDFFLDSVPDPDSALALDPNFDEIIRQQSDVHACMRLRELTVASMPWRVEPSDKKGINPDLAQAVADYVHEVIAGLPDLEDLFKNMQNAVLMGGQGIEFNWSVVDGYERPVEFFPVHKSRFCFDRQGRMNLYTREFPVWGVTVAEPTNSPVEPQKLDDGTHIVAALGGKFLYHKYTVEGGPYYRPASEGYLYYGRGEDTYLYLPVTFDHFVLRFHMKWLEKHGMPLSILYHPDNQPASSVVMQIANSIRGEGVVRIPRPVGVGNENNFYKLEFQDPPATGVQAFMDFHNNWTKPSIEKILLGGANLLELGEHGAYSASVNQRDAGADIIFRWDGKKIATTITRQLVPYIVTYRFGGISPKYYPKFFLEPKEINDQTGRLEVVEQAATMVPVRESDIYEAAGLQKPKEDEDCVFLGQQNEQGAGSPFDMFPGAGGTGGPGGLPGKKPGGGRPMVPGAGPGKQNPFSQKKGGGGGFKPKTPIGQGKSKNGIVGRRQKEVSGRQ